MISTKDKIKMLCIMNNTSINKLESECGFAKGYISKIDKSSPSSENLQKMADFFLIDTDYLITDSRIAYCPICKYVYDPLDEYNVDQHKKHHYIYVKACKSFGQIHDYIETVTMPQTLKNIFTDSAFYEYTDEEYLELCDKRLDHEFSHFIWFEITNYGFTSNIDERKFRWEWKQNYIEENIRPSDDLSLKVCNLIRKRFEVEELTPESVVADSKDFLYRLYSNVIVHDKAEHYFKMFIKLPPERRKNIYDQIDFQYTHMIKETEDIS